MVEENISLKSYNTFGIDVTASKFSSFASTQELISLLKDNNQELLILGGGSNVLFTKNYNGLVLKNDIKGIDIIEETESLAYIKAGSGVVWHEFVLKTIDLNFSGIENLSLIPGSVGASPMQNIGAYGTEIKDVFHSLEALNLKTKEIETFSNEACKFGYRESVFKKELKDKYIITSVTFKLSKKHVVNAEYGAIKSELSSQNITEPTIKDISNAVIAIRKSKLPDPNEIGNAGSFFKNPIISIDLLASLKSDHPNIPNYPIDENSTKVAAGWLIEQAGWKGKTFGEYGVHLKQALVLVNYGNCKGEEILNLSQNIIDDVMDKFSIQLEREVNIL